MSELNKERFKLIAFLKELGSVLGNVLTSDDDVILPTEDVFLRESAKPDSDGNIPDGKMSLGDAAKLTKTLRDVDKVATQMQRNQENGGPSKEKGKNKRPQQEIQDEKMQIKTPEQTYSREREFGED